MIKFVEICGFDEYIGKEIIMKAKKMTSLILAVLMVLSVIPMVAFTASAALPQETFGRATYETVVLYDAGDPISGAGGWGTYSSGVGTEIAASGKKAVDADGILIDLKWTEASAAVQFKFKLDNNPSANNANGVTDGSYYGKGTYSSGTSATGNWLVISATAWEGTVFIPKEKLNNWNSATFDVISVALTAGATYDNIRLAYKVSETPIESGAPAKLPTTNAEFDISYLSEDFTWSAQGNTKFTPWWGTVFKSAGDAWLTGEGLLFKFDTSNVPDTNEEIMGLAIQFTAGNGGKYKSGDTDGNPTDGKSSYYFISAGLFRYHNGGVYTYNGTLAKEQEEGVCSTTWYYSTDGQTWNSAVEDATKSRCVYLTKEHTEGYIFVPFEELWCVGPGGKGFGGYMKAGTFEEGLAEIKANGGDLSISNFGLCPQSASSGKTENLAILSETVFSEFSVATCKHEWKEGSVINQPSHTEAGSQNVFCEKCGVSSTKEIAKLPDHILGDRWVEDDDTNHRQSCICGEVVREAHVWDDGYVSTEPTVEAEGVKVYTCTTKGCEATKEESIDKLPAPATTNTPDEEDSGCGSVIGGGFAMMALVSGAAVMLTRKKRRF